MFLRDFLSVLGIFGVVVTVTSFFDQLKVVNDAVKSTASLLVMLAVGLLWAVWNNRPRNKFEYKLASKDIRMQLVIGDIFHQKGSMIVPINNEFDASLGGSVLKSSSIKARVIKEYFSGDCGRLGERLRKKLATDTYKTSKDGPIYKMGTTVTIEHDERKFYFTANSRKVNHGRVEARSDDLVPTLSGLWAYLADYASKGTIVVPILGTGNGRLSISREEVFKEIVRSFIASCSEKSYCDRLVIAIHPEDVVKCEIDIDMLNEFLMLNCKYATFANNRAAAVGTAAS